MERVTKIVTILGGAFVVMVAASIFVAFHVVQMFVPDTRIQEPAEFATAKITTGAADFGRSIFYREDDLGEITELRYEAIGPGPLLQLAIVGTGGGVFLSADRVTSRKFRFSSQEPLESVVLAEPVNADEPLFLSHGSWSSPVILYDSSGLRLWHYDGTFGVDDAAAGDLEGDGKMKVAVGMNGAGGIHLLDADGREIWSRPDGNVWHVEILAGASGAPGRILNSNARGQLVLRDSEGKVIRRADLDTYTSNFTLVRWGDDRSATCVVVAGPYDVYVYTPEGRPIASFHAPGPTLYDDIRATNVRFSPGSTDFAVLRNYGRWNRSVLSINGAQGVLVYREILDDTCDSLAAFPDRGNETLLVGCGGKVWQYAPIRGSATQSPK
jgi:hypothetical protein